MNLDEENMLKRALKLLDRIATAVESIEKQGNPVIISPLSTWEETPKPKKRRAER